MGRGRGVPSEQPFRQSAPADRQVWSFSWSLGILHSSPRLVTWKYLANGAMNWPGRHSLANNRGLVAGAASPNRSSSRWQILKEVIMDHSDPLILRENH